MAEDQLCDTADMLNMKSCVFPVMLSAFSEDVYQLPCRVSYKVKVIEKSWVYVEFEAGSDEGAEETASRLAEEYDGDWDCERGFQLCPKEEHEYKVALSPEEGVLEPGQAGESKLGPGLFRYMDSGSDPGRVDDSAVRLLEKIAEMKKGTPQEPAAQALLERFWEITKAKETISNAQQ